MKYQIVCVRDKAVESFSRPVFVGHLGSALRSFGDEVKRSDSEMAKHPDDFSLWHIGQWDEESGSFESMKPHKLGEASQFVSE